MSKTLMLQCPNCGFRTEQRVAGSVSFVSQYATSPVAFYVNDADACNSDGSLFALVEGGQTLTGVAAGKPTLGTDPAFGAIP
jgi:hypothetical protein